MKNQILWMLLLFVGVISPFFSKGQSKKPIIGVSCSWSATEMSVPNTYLFSIMQAGGLPVIIPLTDNLDILREQVANLDGLVMTGGEDFDPLLYGQEPLQGLGSVVPERDTYDLALIQFALERDIPLLCVCRGEQGLNIVNGGTLFQDIPSTYKAPYLKHRQSLDKRYGSHAVIIDKSSTLYKILGSDKFIVNTFHHQAIDKVAPGYKVVARATDGIIEAIEKEGNTRVIAVQWHPEALTWGGDKEMLKIFQYVVGEAAKGKK